MLVEVGRVAQRAGKPRAPNPRPCCWLVQSCILRDPYSTANVSVALCLGAALAGEVAHWDLQFQPGEGAHVTAWGP